MSSVTCQGNGREFKGFGPVTDRLLKGLFLSTGQEDLFWHKALRVLALNHRCYSQQVSLLG